MYFVAGKERKIPPLKRSLWSENTLKAALQGIRNGMAVLKTSQNFGPYQNWIQNKKSNTTHELKQFRSFEPYWSNFFPKVFPKAKSSQNLQSAFKSTGIFPSDSTGISDAAFAPSTVTYKENPEKLMQALEG